MVQGKYLTVIEADAVSEEIAKQSLTNPWVEEVFEALKLRISWEPLCGELVMYDGVDYRLVINTSIKIAENPQVLVRYRTNVDGESLIIDFVKVYPFDPSNAYNPPAFDLGS